MTINGMNGSVPPQEPRRPKLYLSELLGQLEIIKGALAKIQGQAPYSEDKRAEMVKRRDELKARFRIVQDRIINYEPTDSP